MLEFNYEQCPGITDSLAARFKWSSRMRFSAALAIVGLLFFTKLLGWTGFPAMPLLIVGLIEMFVNQPYPSYVRRVKNPETVLFLAQFIDVVLITWGVHILGGMNAFYMILIYPMAIVFTGIVISPVYTFVIANLSFFFYAGLVYLEYHGVIPLHPVHHVQMPGMERFVITLLILPFYNLLAFFSTYLAAQLKRREQQLVETKMMLTQAGKLASRRAQMMAGKDMAQRIYYSLSMVGDSVRSLLAQMPESDPIHADMNSLEAEFYKLNNLVNETLAETRETSKRRETAARQMLSVHSVIDEALELLSIPLKKSGVEIYREYDSALPQIHGDAEQLRQVFFNFLSFLRNSLGPARAGKIWIRTRHVRSQDSQDPVVEVVLKHDGSSPEKDVSRLFASSSSAVVAGVGGGLGLFISHGIVQAHNGRVRAVSPESGGLAFYLTFPVSSRISDE